MEYVTIDRLYKALKDMQFDAQINIGMFQSLGKYVWKNENECERCLVKSKTDDWDCVNFYSCMRERTRPVQSVLDDLKEYVELRPDAAFCLDSMIVPKLPTAVLEAVGIPYYTYKTLLSPYVRANQIIRQMNESGALKFITWGEAASMLKKKCPEANLGIIYMVSNKAFTRSMLTQDFPDLMKTSDWEGLFEPDGTEENLRVCILSEDEIRRYFKDPIQIVEVLRALKTTQMSTIEPPPTLNPSPLED